MTCNICKNKNIKALNYFGEIPRSFDFNKKKNIKKYKFVLNKCSQCSVIQLKKNGKNHSFIPKLDMLSKNSFCVKKYKVITGKIAIKQAAINKL